MKAAAGRHQGGGHYPDECMKASAPSFTAGQFSWDALEKSFLFAWVKIMKETLSYPEREVVQEGKPS